jgi:isoquinoline 1-oxidoreductase alpha subunit
MSISLNLNGKMVSVNAPASSNLLWVLRDILNMTGTKYGCGSKICGSCVVLVDGVAQKTCNLKLSQLTPANVITTIEGLSPTSTHPVQQAWIAQQVPQCGFCQSGMIMATVGLLNAIPIPTDADIDAAIDNICVCGTYQRVRAAIHQAAGG